MMENLAFQGADLSMTTYLNMPEKIESMAEWPSSMMFCMYQVWSHEIDFTCAKYLDWSLGKIYS